MLGSKTGTECGSTGQPSPGSAYRASRAPTKAVNDPSLGNPYEAEDHTLHTRVVCHHVGGHEDDHHLHRELQQGPEPSVPCEGDLGHPGPLRDERGARGDVGQHDGEEERARHPPLYPIGDGLPKPLDGSQIRFTDLGRQLQTEPVVHLDREYVGAVRPEGAAEIPHGVKTPDRARSTVDMFQTKKSVLPRRYSQRKIPRCCR